MKDVNKKLIDNLLKQSEILLDKTILLSEDIKTEVEKIQGKDLEMAKIERI